MAGENSNGLRSDGLEDFPARFDDNWTAYDSTDLDAMRIVLPQMGFNFDDNGIYFARALDYVKARTYTRLLPPLSGDRLVPTSTDTPASAQSVTYSIYDSVGMAKIIANYADDLPRADVRGREVSVLVRGIGDSYGYTQQDLRSALATNSNLPGRKADAARSAVARKENSLKIVGDTDYGMYGLTNHPNIPTVAAITGSWATATGDQIVADTSALLNAIINQSNGIHTPNVLAMTNQSRSYMFSKRMSGAAQTLAGDALRAQYPDVEFVVAQELRGKGSAGTDMMVAGQRDIDNYYYDSAMEFTQHPPQARNLEFVVPCEARAAGLVVVRPLSLATMGGL
jgi:hypothetical protein